MATLLEKHIGFMMDLLVICNGTFPLLQEGLEGKQAVVMSVSAAQNFGGVNDNETSAVRAASPSGEEKFPFIGNWS